MRILAGLLSGLFASAAMNVAARAVTRARGGREADGAAPGRYRTGRGAQPPQAKGAAEHDGAVIAGTTAYRMLTGKYPPAHQRLALGTAAHYAFGAAVGAAYAVASARVPALRKCYGTAYGTLVWLIADEGMMPALGLSRSAKELSAGVLAFGLGTHLVYGAALETGMRVLSGPAKASPYEDYYADPYAEDGRYDEQTLEGAA
jgi:putative membrane protein